ncbi:hypothetical protein B0H13DRAFT_1889927 [Mycena leptocephala]|nr:hypothetical protein B0H13DRAFT_1889927 [Mycena leptocephala]
MTTVELDVVTLNQDQRLRRSLFLAGVCVVMYDYVLTFNSEVKNIWSSRFRRSSAWFLLFRYVTLISNLTMLAFFLGNLSAEIENYLLVAQEFFIGCGSTIIPWFPPLTFTQGTLSLRVCAMYGFNRKVFISLSIAALTTVGLGAWSVAGPQIILETSVPGCHVTTSKNQSVDDCGPDSFALIWFQVVPQVSSTATPAHYLTPPTGVALAWEAQLVCDMLILGLTLHRAWTYHRSVGLGSASLLRTMSRDGAVYFGMICLVNLSNIVMLYSGDVSISNVPRASHAHGFKDYHRWKSRLGFLLHLCRDDLQTNAQSSWCGQQAIGNCYLEWRTDPNSVPSG